MTAMTGADDTRIGITPDPLSVGELHDWAVHPRCGAVVVFSGTVRDHAEGREGVHRLEYEAYTEQVEPRLAAIVEELRIRWPDVVRVALVHRVGPCELGEPTVVAAVSSPHRPAGFAAARFAIDALKASVPIWKREVWDGGEDWGLAATDLVDASAVESPDSP
jgi:molybdopterin synthase catalytic subunit